LYFSADNGTGGELWKTDGSTGGTVIAVKINKGNRGSLPGSFIVFNDLLYFSATDGIIGNELWKSDGTDGGTMLVKDIQPGQSGSHIENITNINGTLYFSAEFGKEDDWNEANSGDREFWKSDGTTNGTVMVKNLWVGNSSYPHSFTNINGTIYFLASISRCKGNMEK